MRKLAALFMAMLLSAGPALAGGTFETLPLGGSFFPGSVLMSACSRPLATAFSLPDLASRVLGATALALQPLDEAELEQAWTMRARLRGLDPDAAAVRWLLRHQRRDFRSLMQALDRLDETALAAQRRLSLPFVRQCLGEPANVNPIGSDPTAV